MPRKEKDLFTTRTQTITENYVIDKDGNFIKNNDKPSYKITIINKIPEQIQIYQDKTGATRTWIAKQLGMSTQNMYKIFESTNMTLETLIKFAYVLGCTLEDLYEYEVETIS